MSKRGGQVAIELAADRLVAVGALVEDGTIDITSIVRSPRPEHVDPRDAEAVGRWVRTALNEAGVSARDAVIGVERHEVALKRLALPVAPKQASDLIGMVRLQMARQLAFPADDAAIDFSIIDAGGQPQTGGGVSGPVVLAAAMPGERVRWLLAMARAAGLRVHRIGLKSAGAAALVARRAQERDGVVLGIVPAGDAIEFVAIERGQLVFSRRAEPTLGETTPDTPARVALEAKRTWMSYRSSPDSGTVSGAVVLGDDETARATAARCTEALEMICRSAALPEEVHWPVQAYDDASVVMLAGLLLEDISDGPSIDLSRTSRPSRLAARRRQIVMVGALGLVLAVGGLFTWGAMQKREALERLDALQNQSNELLADRRRVRRDQARLDHLHAWEATGPSWLEHIAAVSQSLPSTDRAIIDDLRGQALKVSVDYKPKSRSAEYDSAVWKSNITLSLAMMGRASNLQVVEQLRETFVRDRNYVVKPIGQDGLSAKDDQYPAAFSLNIAANPVSSPTSRTTSEPAPRQKEATP